MANVKLVCLSIACMAVIISVIVRADVNCNQLLFSLQPCLSYVQGDGTTPSSGCCNGVNTVFNNANTTTDRQQTCQCLQEAAKEFPGSFDPKRVAALPGACGLNLPYNLTTSTNCKSIK